MYIEPNTTIKIYHNVPLDNTYEHTIYFGSVEAQMSYFHGNPSILKQNLERNSYQRVTRGIMRVEMTADSLYDCNYLAFKNTNYGQKWFYAFIINVEYINNITSEITYEIDVMQTYLFDMQLRETFVEREHASHDVAGDNIISENFNISDYYYGTRQRSQFFGGYRYVMVTPYKFEGSAVIIDYGSRTITNNPTCLHHYIYHGASQQDSANALVADIFTLNEAGHADGIECIYIVPAYFVGDTSGTTSGRAEDLPSSITTADWVVGAKPTTLGDYTPRNQKLLTYPYNKLSVTTLNGETYDYAYEYFEGSNIGFRVFANLTTNTSFKCVPLFYKHHTGANYIEGAIMAGLPMLPYAIDTYREWLAQNKSKQGVAMLGSVLGNFKIGYNQLFDSVDISGGKMSRNSVESIASILAQDASARKMPPKVNGSTDGSLEIAMDVDDFNCYQMFIPPQLAKVIDDFFDKYGYATNELKIPNRNVRQNWTYIKTRGCVIVGSAPSDDIKKVCQIYDHGITFWNNPSAVGNYSLPNAPL